MAIFYSVRADLTTAPPFIDDGKLEALAITQSGEYKKLEAETIAQNAADYHGMSFQIFKVEERLHGTYRPKDIIHGNSVLAKP